MPRIIFKCPYIKPGTRKAAAHLSNYVRYVATRDGVEKLTPDRATLPATKKQQDMVAQLSRDFPLSRGLFEYADYQSSPTCGNASEFISRAIEDNYDQIAKRENYVSYIAQRPRAERVGSHGLFSGTDDLLVLSRITEEVAKHPGNVWLPIISLRREDAARLGYDNAERWRTFLRSYAMEMAEAMKIPWEQFRWYAAFHDEGHHPHVHMVCYSADGKSGFLTKEGIAKIKAGLAKEIFQQDLTEIYQRQTQRRDELVQKSGEVMKTLIQEMRTGTLENPRIEKLTSELAEDRKAAVYWFTLASAQGNQYAQFFLDHMNDSPSLFASASRLLHHMGNIFREQAPPSPGGITFVDSKLRRKIREKKIAMGHKPDDHEEQIYQQELR